MWCRWHIAQNERGKTTKVPFHPNHDPSDLSQGRFASNKATPYSFAAVATSGPINGEQGVGFVFAGGVENKRGEHIVALDVDGCRDPITGNLTKWGRELFEASGRSYTEVSPSGCGIRIFVAVDGLPARLTCTKVKVNKDAAPNVPEHKAVEVQLFTTAGYVTVTGDRLVEAQPEIESKIGLAWLTALYPGFTAADPITDVLPKGAGDASTVAHVVAAVELMQPNVRAAIVEADWGAILPEGTGSASEAYYRVCQHVYRAANGHGAVALEYLLNETYWGGGLVEGSADPAKYSRRSWVTGELKRIAGKASTVNAAKGFSPVAGDWTCPEVEQSQAAAAAAAVAAGSSAIDDRWPDAPPAWLDIRPAERKYLLHHPEDDAGALPLGEVGILSAEGGAGKTTAVVQLAVSIATGGAWFGHYRTHPDNARRVALLLGEENAIEVHRKLYWTCANLGLSPEEREQVMRNVVPVPLASCVVPLLQLGLNGNIESTVHSQRIRARLHQGDPWGLVVVDPISRFCGVNVEGDNILATRFVQELETFCAAPGTPTTLALAHSSKMARRLGEADSRGVTGLTDGARWWGTLVNQSKERVRFDVRKSNYTRPAAELHLLRGERGILCAESSDDRVKRAALEQEDQQTREDRKQNERHARIGAILRDVIDTLKRQPGLTKNNVASVTKAKRADVLEAVDRGLASGAITPTREGSRVLLSACEVFK